MQSSNHSNSTSRYTSSFLAHTSSTVSGSSISGTISRPLSGGAAGGFSLDSKYSQPSNSLQRRNRLEQLVHGVDRSLPLPTSPRGYLLYLCGLILITGGMAILTLMSAQIVEAQRELRQLNQDYTLIQQRNSELVWLISRETNLERIQRRLAGRGYVPVTDVEYVVVGANDSAPLSPWTQSSPDAAPAMAPGADTPTDTSADTFANPGRAEGATVHLEQQPATSATQGSMFAEQPPADNWLSSLGEGLTRWESLFLDRGEDRAEITPAGGNAGMEHAEPFTSSSLHRTQHPGQQDVLPWELPALEMPSLEMPTWDALSNWQTLLPWQND